MVLVVVVVVVVVAAVDWVRDDGGVKVIMDSPTW